MHLDGSHEWVPQRTVIINLKRPRGRANAYLPNWVYFAIMGLCPISHQPGLARCHFVPMGHLTRQLKQSVNDVALGCTCGAYKLWTCLES